MKKVNFPLVLILLSLFLQLSLSCKSDLNTDSIRNKSVQKEGQNTTPSAPTPLDTTNPDDLYREAGKYFKNKQYGLSEHYLQKAMRLKPAEPDYFMALADLYMEQNQSRRALDILEQGVLAAPKDTIIRLKQLQFLLITQQYASGIQKSEELLAMDPQSAETYFLRGLIFKETRNDSMAFRDFQQAVDIDPKLSDAYINLGDLYAKNDDPLALKYYQNALAFDKQNPIAKHSLAYYYQNHGQMDKAIELYKDIEAITPGYPEAYLNLGVIYLNEGKVPEAYEQLSILTELDDQIPEAHYYRALAAEQLGMPQKALFEMKEAVSLNPEDKQARKELDRLMRKQQ